MIGNGGNSIGRKVEPENFQGRSNADKRSAVQMIHVAMTQTPKTNPHTPKLYGKSHKKTSISLREKDKFINIPWTTFLRHKKSFTKTA